MDKNLTANAIRQQFIDFFVEKKGHTYVASSSLIPGGDATLLFTNAGMVQFKDVFLGTDKRPYTRATNSQKCMRVAGKHNDLEDVGKDDTHHTFFEMLGNWSFGDYYKKEAIEWAWELLTEVWGLPKEDLYVTCFKDEQGEIPTDEEAAGYWAQQPGLNKEHILYLGRKDNFWEMADTGPCGPNSEIHLDRGPEFGEITYLPNGDVDLDGPRFLELWNLVFIQYNRTGPNTLEPLPNKHVDTGMGFERIVSVLQDKNSNYKTDLFTPVLDVVQELARHSDEDREEHFTPYRVIGDHARAAAFLIADGVIPGNIGRNYITRMIVRRAARFGSKIGLDKPFMAMVAQAVIEQYGDAYPELVKNAEIIKDNLTREETRFQKTVESGIDQLDGIFSQMQKEHKTEIPGDLAFDLYSTYGLPYEITRDIASEKGFTVNEPGFKEAMEQHRIASGAGSTFGEMGGDDSGFFADLLTELQDKGDLGPDGVLYDPYSELPFHGKILAIIKDGQSVEKAQPGDTVEVVLPQTCFYLESGGQVADTGWIKSSEGNWNVDVEDVRRPAAGLIVHQGTVKSGEIVAGDSFIAQVDHQRRLDIQRNHTATHLLHSALHKVLGDHARQAGSMVAPDRLRFDFNHPQAMTKEEIAAVEADVNQHILENHHLNIKLKSLDEAKAEGAMALFGEKYGDIVRTITIGDEDTFSYELCGGTHVDETAEIGTFLITAESSIAAGVRRIEAVTGREAYKAIQEKQAVLKELGALLNTSEAELGEHTSRLLQEISDARKTIDKLKAASALDKYKADLKNPLDVDGISVVVSKLEGVEMNTLRELSDTFRNTVKSGVTLIGSIANGQPYLLASVTDDLVKRGLHAGNLIKETAPIIGGKGGGRPNMAQAGGKDAAKLQDALDQAVPWIKANLK